MKIYSHILSSIDYIEKFDTFKECTNNIENNNTLDLYYIKIKRIVKRKKFDIKMYNKHFICTMPVLYELIMAATHGHVRVIIKYFITRIKKRRKSISDLSECKFYLYERSIWRMRFYMRERQLMDKNTEYT